MATRHRTPNKPELVAIYRLEFYKNKKCWKFPSEKQLKSKPAGSPKKTGRNNTLNETFIVDQPSDLKNVMSPINHAFMHEVPTDNTCLEHSAPSPPPPSPQPQAGLTSEQAAAPALCAEGLWNQSQAQQDELHQDVWTNEACGDNQEPLVNTQDQPTWDSNIQTLATNTPTNHQSECNNQDQPINLQWLLKASALDACQKSASPGHPNTWHNQLISQAIQPEQKIWLKQHELMAQHTWKTPEKSLDKHGTLPNMNDQVWQKNEDQYYRNPALDQCNEQVVRPQQWDSNQNCTPKKEASFVLPDTSVPPPPLRSGIWPDKPRIFTPNNPRLHRRTYDLSPRDGMTIPAEVFHGHQRPAFDHSRTLVPCTDGSLGSPRVEDVPQNVWVNQAWQEKQALWLDGSKNWRDAADAPDAPDGIYEEMPTYLDTHSAQEKSTLKSHPAECYETPEDILRQTDFWLRRLMKVYHSGDEQYDSDHSFEEYRRGYNDSSDFVREAHDVAHSSENDPSESLEWVWSLSAARLAAQPPRRVAAALRHVAATLRALLREQLIRNRLKSDHATEVEEYPTRDKEVFDGEYVLSGSHLPRSTRGLGGEAPSHRLIKIDMGRPYRL